MKPKYKDNQVKRENHVAKFTQLAEMLFKPKRIYPIMKYSKQQKIDPSSPLITHQQQIKVKKRIIPLKKSSKQQQKHYINVSSQKSQQLEGQNQMSKQPQKQSSKEKTYSSLKYIQHLSSSQQSSLLLIGNENQIDLLQISVSKSSQDNIGYVYTQNYWSLNFNYGPITAFAVSKRNKNDKRKIAMASGCKLQLYSFSDKININQQPIDQPINQPIDQSIKQPIQQPNKLKYLQFKQQIIKLQFYKKQSIVVYFADCINIFQFFQLEKTGFQTYLSVQMSYNIQQGSNLQLFSISNIIQHSVKIFLTKECNQDDKHRTFGLYYIEIEFYPDHVTIYPLKKIYDIKNQLKSSISIHNYSKQIILVNFGSQIIAIKNGLIIDNAIVNFQQKNCFIKYMSDIDELIHVQNNKIEVYQFYLSAAVNPQKIIINSKDSISFTKPQSGDLINIINLNYGYCLFFQLSLVDKNNNFSQKQINNGQSRYWFCLPFELSIEQKLDQIFPSRHQIQQLSIDELKQICDMAIKMGLTQKQAYYQLWKRTQRNTSKSLQILMLTYDFDTIINELSRTMNRKSLKYRDVIKILKNCATFLQIRVFQNNCTQKTILQYVRAKFFINKLQTFKDIQLARKNNQNQKLKIMTDYGFKQALQQIVNTNMNSFNLKQGINGNSFVQAIQRMANKKTQKQQNQILSQQKKPLIQQKNSSRKQIISEVIKSKTWLHIQSKKQIACSKQLMIGIKDFKYYLQKNIKQLIISEINQFMYNPNIGDHIQVIRIFIKNFKILYRLLYEQIMIQVIRNHKSNVITLLKVFPQFLPLNQDQINRQQSKIKYQTIWDQIDHDQIQNNVFLNQLKTIQNRQIIQGMHKSIWIKRNHYTLHGLIFQDKDLITNSQKFQSSKNKFFYIFYAEMFKSRNLLESMLEQMKKQSLQKHHPTGYDQQMICKKFETIKQINIYINRNYILVPDNLKRLSEIYYLLYFKTGHILKDNGIQSYNIQKFIQLKNDQLFQLYFKIQKVHKGFLLQIMYKLYKKYLKQGDQTYRQGLQQYFMKSPSTAVSDLKIILNRFNSLPKDYQLKNEKLFQILIKCLMYIIKIGVNQHNQINLESQLLIYVRDVCFRKNNQRLIHDLKKLNHLNSKIPFLKLIQINMPIVDILEKGQDVLKKAYQHQINRHEIKLLDNYQSYRLYSFKIIAHLNSFRSQLYGIQYEMFGLFIYFSETMKQINLIQFGIRLLEDKKLKQFFNFDTSFKQSLFYYLYHWKISQFSYDFLSHQGYLRQVLNIVEEDNSDRKFFQLQLAYANIFKDLGNKISYPISLSYKIPSLNEIQTHILTSKNLKSMDPNTVKKLFSILDQMRVMYEPHVKQNLQKKKNWFLRELYQIFLCKSLRQDKLPQAIQITKEILKLSFTQNAIINPILIIQSMLQYLGQGSKLAVIQLISYFFYDPLKMTQILESLLNTKRTTIQFEQYIYNQIQMVKKQKNVLSFSPTNLLFQESFVEFLNKRDQNDDLSFYYNQFEIILQNVLNHVLSSKQQFKKNKIYRIYFKILCHSPHSLAKFIFCKPFGIDLKNFRAFLSYLIHQVPFIPKRLLFIGKAILQINLYRMTHNMTMDQIIKQYQKNPFDQEFVLQNQQIQLKSSEKILYQCINKFNQKIIYFQENDLQNKIKHTYQKVNTQYERKMILQRNKIMNKISRGQINIKKQQKKCIQANSKQTPLLSQNDQPRLIDFSRAYNSSHKLGQFQMKSVLKICELSKSQQSKQLAFEFPSVQQIFLHPQHINQLVPSKYLFKDKDDNYEIKENDFLMWTAHVQFPSQIIFDQVAKRHDVFGKLKNTRFSNQQQICRKKSAYFQQTFLGKKSNHNQLSDSNITFLMFDNEKLKFDSSDQKLKRNNQKRNNQKPKYGNILTI